MFRSCIILGLSTCAVALQARYVEGYFYANGVVVSKSLGASVVYTLKPSSTPRPVQGIPGYRHSASDIPYPTGSNNTSVKPGPTGTPKCAPYWLENIKHQGLASFNPELDSYQVFRNVKDYGAKGKR